MAAKKPRILVADDQRGMRLTLSGIIEDQGYNVTVAEDGYQALNAVKKSAYDLIFLDIKMPGLDGMETFRKIREVRPDSTVVLMTAFAMDEEVTEALQQGVSSIIYKPFDMQSVVALVESLTTTVDVLVVDGRRSSREGVRALLEPAGCTVEEASTGEQALEMVRERRFDLLLVNIQTDKDGLAAMHEIRAAAPESRVIFTSGGPRDKSEGTAIELGGNPEGPVNTADILDLVKRITAESDG